MTTLRFGLLSLLSLSLLSACPEPEGDGPPIDPLCAVVSDAPATHDAIRLVTPTGALPLAFVERFGAMAERLTGASGGVDVDESSTDATGTLNIVLQERPGDESPDGIPQQGYRARWDGSNTVTVEGATAFDLMFGAYGVLEAMGLRYFHPLETIRLGGATDSHLVVDERLNHRRSSPFKKRGLHVHLLHPTEYYRAFFEPSAENLAVARALIDWLVMTGQNHIQYFHLADADWDTLRPHLDAIVAYAHEMGVTIGFVGQLFENGMGLQRAYVFVHDAEGWRDELAASLADVMATDFDSVDFSFGEFFAEDVVLLQDMLNAAVQTLSDAGIDAGAQNHVGNYEDLYLQHNGEELYYYHIPGTVDVRLRQSVHTVFFYDVYRDWAMYSHESFAFQRDYMFQELQERKVDYFPESAYWVSADIDVPLFLSEYLRSRHNDIRGLVADAASRGLPPLNGHVLYTSGHEWNYWMVDYLTARMLFDVDAPLSAFTDHIAEAYVGCEDSFADLLTDYMDVSTTYLWDKRLTGYIIGEDGHDDLGYAAGFETHPRPLSFGTLRNVYTDEERAGYRRDVVDELYAGHDAFQPLHERAEALCPQVPASIRPFCDEFRDAVAMMTLRFAFAASLYDGVLDVIERNETGDAKINEAEALILDAEPILLARIDGYRFPADELIAPFENLTRYPFGLLRQAHTLCLWHRPVEKARLFLERGDDPSPFDFALTCQD